MTALLLIISFLLHVILFMAIYQLYKQIQQLKDSKNSELQTVAEQFISEIKEENKRLQERLSQYTHLTTPKKTSNTSQNSDDPISHTSAQPTKVSSNSKTHHISDLTGTRHEEMELSLESKILQLYQKGLEIDQIAKQLKCGRTEVELIVHLQQQLKHNT